MTGLTMILLLVNLNLNNIQSYDVLEKNFKIIKELSKEYQYKFYKNAKDKLKDNL